LVTTDFLENGRQRARAGIEQPAARQIGNPRQFTRIALAKKDWKHANTAHPIPSDRYQSRNCERVKPRLFAPSVINTGRIDARRIVQYLKYGLVVHAVWAL
jgi:hypothetical protein